MKALTKREFVASMGALAAMISGCGSDDDNSGSGGSGGSSGTAGSGGTGGSGGTAASGGSSSGGSAGQGGAASGGTSSGGTAGTASGGSAGTTGGSCGQGIEAQISCRHNHAMHVSAADIEAGVEMSYNIKGTATHSHTVTVTAAMFADLKAGKTVEIFVPSSNQPHTVYLDCSNPDPSAKDNDACN